MPRPRSRLSQCGRTVGIRRCKSPLRVQNPPCRDPEQSPHLGIEATPGRNCFTQTTSELAQIFAIWPESEPGQTFSRFSLDRGVSLKQQVNLRNSFLVVTRK